MKPLPHHYRASIENEQGVDPVIVRSPGVPDLETLPPVEYGGAGDRWSPETLLMAAVADCYVLSFRAIARASKLEWQTLRCEVDGTLDKADGVVRFTTLSIRAGVTVAVGSESRAERILEKAKDTCLITNSLTARVDFQGQADAA
jgi:organic hydroperoxide reductase OsmC/OhrA